MKQQTLEELLLQAVNAKTFSAKKISAKKYDKKPLQTLEELLEEALSNKKKYDRKPFTDNGSSEVTKLRKDGKLHEAYTLGLKLYKEQPNDIWIQRTYAWVLIAIIKAELSKDINKAHDFFKELKTINYVTDDEVLSKQINSLRRHFNPEYALLVQAEALSKDGNHIQSLEIFRKMNQGNTLNKDSLDTYGWVIYRYIKASEVTLSVKEIKKLLFEYLKLENERPSLLHSVILQFVVHYVSTHKDFDIFKFFQIWDATLLRYEDTQEQYSNGRKYPSLLNRLLNEIVDSGHPFDINYLFDTVKGNEILIEYIRKRYFWNISNAHKENRLSEFWNLFDFYVANYSNYD